MDHLRHCYSSLNRKDKDQIFQEIFKRLLKESQTSQRTEQSLHHAHETTQTTSQHDLREKSHKDGSKELNVSRLRGHRDDHGRSSGRNATEKHDELNDRSPRKDYALSSHKKSPEMLYATRRKRNYNDDSELEKDVVFQELERGRSDDRHYTHRKREFEKHERSRKRIRRNSDSDESDTIKKRRLSSPDIFSKRIHTESSSERESSDNLSANDLKEKLNKSSSIYCADRSDNLLSHQRDSEQYDGMKYLKHRQSDCNFHIDEEFYDYSRQSTQREGDEHEERRMSRSEKILHSSHEYKDTHRRDCYDSDSEIDSPRSIDKMKRYAHVKRRQRERPYDMNDSTSSDSLSPPRESRSRSYRRSDSTRILQDDFYREYEQSRLYLDRHRMCKSGRKDQHGRSVDAYGLRQMDEITLLKEKLKSTQLQGTLTDQDIDKLAGLIHSGHRKEIAYPEEDDNVSHSSRISGPGYDELEDSIKKRATASARKSFSLPSFEEKLSHQERAREHNDKSGSPADTDPVVVLSELQSCVKYELLSEFGDSTNKLYTMQVTFDKKTFIGTGNSKDTAKVEAAKLALKEEFGLDCKDKVPSSLKKLRDDYEMAKRSKHIEDNEVYKITLRTRKRFQEHIGSETKSKHRIISPERQIPPKKISPEKKILSRRTSEKENMPEKISPKRDFTSSCEALEQENKISLPSKQNCTHVKNDIKQTTCPNGHNQIPVPFDKGQIPLAINHDHMSSVGRNRPPQAVENVPQQAQLPLEINYSHTSSIGPSAPLQAVENVPKQAQLPLEMNYSHTSSIGSSAQPHAVENIPQQAQLPLKMNYSHTSSIIPSAPPHAVENIPQQAQLPLEMNYSHTSSIGSSAQPHAVENVPQQAQLPLEMNYSHMSSIGSSAPPQAVENIPQQAQRPLEMNYSHTSSIGSSAPPQAVENVPQQAQLSLDINYSHTSSIGSSVTPQLVQSQQMPFSHQFMTTERFDQNTAPVYPQYPGSQINPQQSFNQSIYATQPYMYGTSASVTQTYTHQLNAQVQQQIPPAFTYPPPMVPPQSVYNQINPQIQYPLLPPYQVSYSTNQATTTQPFSYQSNISIPPPPTSQIGVQPATNVHYQTEVSSIEQIWPNNTAQSKVSAGGTSNSSDAKKQKEPEKLKLRDEKCEKLSKVKDLMGKEIEELANSLVDCSRSESEHRSRSLKKGVNKPEPAVEIVCKLNMTVFDKPPLSLYKTFDEIKLKWLVNVMEMVKNSNIQPVSYECLSRLMLPECTEAVQKAALKDIKSFLNSCKLLFITTGNNVTLKETHLKWYIKSEKTLPSSSNPGAAEIFPYLSWDVKNEIEKDKNKTGSKFIWRLNPTVFDNLPLSCYRKENISYTQLLVSLCEKLKNCKIKSISFPCLIELIGLECAGKMERYANANFQAVIAEHELLFLITNDMVTLKENHLRWTKEPYSMGEKDKNSTEQEIMWRLNEAVFSHPPLSRYTRGGKNVFHIKLLVRLLEKLKNCTIKPLSTFLLVESTGPLKRLTSKDIKRIVCERGLLFFIKKDMVTLREDHLVWTKVTKPKEIKGKARDNMEPAAKPQWKLDKKVFNEEPLKYEYITFSNTLLLSSLLEKLKNSPNQQMFCDTLYKSILPECTPRMKEALGKCMSDYLHKYDIFFQISDQTVTLKEKHLRWINIQENKVPPTASVIKDSKDEEEEVSTGKWILDRRSLFTSVVKILKDETDLKILVESLEMLKNNHGFSHSSDLCKHLNRKSELLSGENVLKEENLFKTWKHCADFMSKFPLLFDVAGDNVELIDKQLKWKFISQDEKETKYISLMDLKMKHGLKDELHKWIIQKRWCNFPDSYRRLPFDGSRDLLLMILRELKHNNASSTLSNIVYCVTTNPWFTTEMKNAVGGQFTVSVVEKFLSKFPTLVLLDGCPVQAFLKDNCLQWLYFPGKKIFTASKSPLETQCNTLLYFRNRILNEIKNECLKWLSFVMLSSFVDSAPDQVKTCVGEVQACWLPWLLNHPCIFQFDANHRLFTLRETVISDFDEPSVSMFHKDYYVLMYIKGLIERKKCSLSLDNLFKLYWLFVIAPKNRDRYHSQHLPIYTHDEFVEFVRVNGESFFTIGESVISVRHPLPVVFISGIYPYDGCENEYIGHGKVKQVSDSYAIIDVGRNCSEDVYLDKNLFKSEIKPLNSCIKIGDWFSFSAVQVEGLKCVDIKQNSKWKATSLWTAKMTFKQLEQSFNINEKETSTSDIVNRDSLLDISKVRSIANSANKTESTQVVISNFEKEPNNKPLTHQEVIKILSDDESQDSNENTDEEMVHIEKSVDTSDNMDETSKPSQGSKDSQIDNITIPTEKGLSSDHNKESKYEAMNTEDSVTHNSNEIKSSESLDQCKIVDKTEDDMSMVTDVHNNVIEGNQVMVNKNNNLTSKMEEKSLNSHLIVKVNSGVDGNEMSESLELCKVVDKTKDDLPMVSETCSSSSEEKKKKILTTKIEQKSSNTCSNNPSTDDTDYVISDFMAQEIKQSNSLVVKEQSEGVQLITKNNVIVESDSNSKENKIFENTDLSKIIEKIDTDSTVTCKISIPVVNDDEMVEKVERNSAIVFGPIKQAVDQGTQTIISGEIVAKEDLPLSVIKSLFS